MAVSPRLGNRLYPLFTLDKLNPHLYLIQQPFITISAAWQSCKQPTAFIPLTLPLSPEAGERAGVRGNRQEDMFNKFQEFENK
jgi:hypothetical protein